MLDQHTDFSSELYSPLFKTTLRDEPVSVWHSTAPRDDAWDLFLQRTPPGEFQQSSFWARYKGIDGWKCLRFVLTVREGIVGGFQVLWRRSRLGRIGYVSKGPIAKLEDEETVGILVELLTRAARRLRLIAMVVQPPGHSRIVSSHLPQGDFAPNRLLEIITANLVVDVSKGMEAIEASMRRTTRQQIRKATRSGVSVREGNEKDVPTFFRLMLETCNRQGVAPNPSTEKALSELWKESQSAGPCRLTLAEVDGHPISGLFCIPFGQAVTLWKKGSQPEYLHLHAMELLYHEALSWAHAHGYLYCDFLALDMGIAQALTHGLPLSVEQKKSRDIFNLGFGGRPMFMPEAFIHFPSLLFRIGYRFFIQNEFILRYLKRMADRVLG